MESNARQLAFAMFGVYVQASPAETPCVRSILAAGMCLLIRKDN